MAREMVKTVEQEQRALEQRAANERAFAGGLPLPYPNPWDGVDPTKLPSDATFEDQVRRVTEFHKHFVRPARKRHPLRLAGYETILRALAEDALTATLIGECAAAAYGALVGVMVPSAGLELCAPAVELGALRDLLRRHRQHVVSEVHDDGGEILRARWDGLDVLIRSDGPGLPDAHRVAALAREFLLSGPGTESVLVADPVTLLRAALSGEAGAARRQVRTLMAFIRVDVVAQFQAPGRVRTRIAPLRSLLHVLGRPTLEEALAASLIAAARAPVDFRFLANHVPTPAQGQQLLQRAPDDAVRADVEAILARRTW